MTPRLFIDLPLESTDLLTLPEPAARHVQVLRLQAGDELALFNGRGGAWPAVIVDIGRRGVRVQLGAWSAIERELSFDVTLAIGMPANERMDGVIEKATELGVHTIQPLVTGRSVLRLAGERAERKVAHWQAIAIAACEQCGRNRIPRVASIELLTSWLEELPTAPAQAARLLLSPRGAATTALLHQPDGAALVLSGPEGGLTDAETQASLACGFEAWSLGTRVLRADTAPLAALAWLALRQA